MYTKVIMTSGISIFGSFNIFGKKLRSSNVVEFERNNPVKPDNVSEEDIFRTAFQFCMEEYHHTKDNPQNISAEYSMILALKKNNLLSNKFSIDLVHSDTFGGRLAAMFVQKILSKDFNCTVNLHEIKELDVSDREKLNQSLTAYLQVIHNLLKKESKDFTCFAPIGGFKVMTIYGYMIASINGFNSYYLHEDNQTLHEVSYLPVHFSEQILYENPDLIRRMKINNGLYKNDIKPFEMDYIKKYSFLFENIDGGFFALSVLGEFITNQPNVRKDFDIKIFLHKEASKVIENNPSEKKFIYSGIIKTLNHLKNTENPLDIADAVYDNQLFLVKAKTPSTGHVLRLFMAYDKIKGELYIRYLELSHKDYDRKRNNNFYSTLNPEMQNSSVYKDYSEEIYLMEE